MNEELKIKLIMHYIAKSHRDAFSNMTVYDVAKDLKIGMTDRKSTRLNSSH